MDEISPSQMTNYLKMLGTFKYLLGQMEGQEQHPTDRERAIFSAIAVFVDLSIKSAFDERVH